MEFWQSHILTKTRFSCNAQIFPAQKNLRWGLQERVILTRSKLSTSIVSFALTPPMQDSFAGATGSPLLCSASLHSSPPPMQLSSFRTLWIPCKQETSNSTVYFPDITPTVTETSTNRKKWHFHVEKEKKHFIILESMMSARTVLVPFCVLMEQRKAKDVAEGSQFKDYSQDRTRRGKRNKK